MVTTDPNPSPDAGPGSAPSRSLGAIIVRRAVIALVLILLMIVPTVVLFVVTKQPSATYAAMAVLIGVMAVAAGGVRIGVIVAIVSALLAPLVIVAGLSPVTGAALMAIMTLTVGRLSVYGLHRAVMLVPILLVWPMLTPVPWIPKGLLAEVNAKLTAAGLTVTEAVAKASAGASSGGTPSSTASATASKVSQALLQQRMDSTYLAWVMLFFFVGAIIPVLVLPFLLRKVGHRPPQTHPRSEAVPYTITITVLSAAATYYCLDHPKLVAGSFLVATILVLAQVGNEIQWKVTFERVFGTLGGVLLLTGLVHALGTVHYTEVSGIPLPLGLYGLGVAFGAVAIIAKFSPRQWIYYIFIVPTATLLNAFTAHQVTDFGKQRLIDNVVGAALVVFAALITLAGTHLASRSGDAAASDPVEMPSPA